MHDILGKRHQRIMGDALSQTERRNSLVGMLQQCRNRKRHRRTFLLHRVFSGMPPSLEVEGVSTENVPECAITYQKMCQRSGNTFYSLSYRKNYTYIS